MDLPVLDTLEELCAELERRPDLYVRYSKGPDADRGEASRDYESGLELPGLSVNTLTPEPWWTRPIEDWVARQLMHYLHLNDRDDRRPWVLTGTAVGRGPDREPLLHPWEPVAALSDELVEEARKVYEDRFDVGRDSSG